MPRGITVIGQVAHFNAGDGVHGREFWKLAMPPTPQIYSAGPLRRVPTGSPVTVTVTVTQVPGGPQRSGEVTFYADGTGISTAQLTPGSAGQATSSVTVTAVAGPQRVVAVYQGSSDYAPATSNTAVITGG